MPAAGGAGAAVDRPSAWRRQPGDGAPRARGFRRGVVARRHAPRLHGARPERSGARARGGAAHRAAALPHRRLGLHGEHALARLRHRPGSGKTTQRTDGDCEHWDVSWHGAHLLAATARHDTRDLDEAQDIVVIGPDGEIRQLTRTTTTVNLPTAAPDGSVYFVGIGDLGADRNDARGRNVWLWRVPVRGRQADARHRRRDDRPRRRPHPAADGGARRARRDARPRRDPPRVDRQ